MKAGPLRWDTLAVGSGLRRAGWHLAGELDPPAGPPELVAVVSLGAAWDAARRRCARAGMGIVAPWRFANLICGTALLATRVNLRPELIGMGGTSRPRRALPP
jgi:hypothetical protein